MTSRSALPLPRERRAPGWWTEAQVRSVLGQRVQLDGLTGPGAAGDEKVQVEAWTCHFTVARSIGALTGRVERHPSRAALATWAPPRGSITVDDGRRRADQLVIQLLHTDGGSVIHRLLARTGADLCVISLDVGPSWSSHRTPPPDATFALLELFKLIRL